LTEFERLGLDSAAPDAADAQKLIRYLLDRGAGRQEVADAVKTGTLGPLALELALRPPGEAVPFPEAASLAGLDTAEAAALWRALGFPDPLSSSATLTLAQTETLKVLAEMGRSLLGSDTTLQLARVMGGSLALLAEAIVDAFRLKVEMPRRIAGEPYSDVVEDYAGVASLSFPALAEAVGDVLRTHVLSVSRSTWSLDEEQATVTRERTVGFADLVGYTSSTRTLSPADLAAAIGRFEAVVSDVVARFDGRLVKLIGDEAMFVVDEPGTGCELALELIGALHADAPRRPVRIGLAAGPIVALHGDYYGEVVNLAARLVKVADPGQVLVSASVVEHLPDRIGFEAIHPLTLKGYEQGVAAFKLNKASVDSGE
jgi:class 3 adenylate cyclase